MVMNLEKLFGTDPKKEAEGVWIDWTEETRFLIARWGNPRHVKILK